MSKSTVLSAATNASFSANQPVGPSSSNTRMCPGSTPAKATRPDRGGGEVLERHALPGQVSLAHVDARLERLVEQAAHAGPPAGPGRRRPCRAGSPSDVDRLPEELARLAVDALALVQLEDDHLHRLALDLVGQRHGGPLVGGRVRGRRGQVVLGLGVEGDVLVVDRRQELVPAARARRAAPSSRARRPRRRSRRTGAGR